MASQRCNEPADLEYAIDIDEESSSIAIRRLGGQLAVEVDNFADLLYILEKDLTIELQRKRPDLLFLHAAALAWRNEGVLLAGNSGSGKSTTAWALLHHGFRYLSDELSPVDLRRRRVFPYPHAICLKRRPPAYPLPDAAIDLERTLHIPTTALPSSTNHDPSPLRLILLVKHRPDLEKPVVRELSAAEASARLYINTLNALAHDDRGLGAVAYLAQHTPCFQLEVGDLQQTCLSVRSLADRVIEHGG